MTVSRVPKSKKATKKAKAATRPGAQKRGRPKSGGFAIEIFFESLTWDFSRGAIKKFASLLGAQLDEFIPEVMKGIPSAQRRIQVLGVHDRQMRGMNLAYRKLDKTTDVLSFPADRAQREGLLTIGDIAISLDMLELQALRYKVSLDREFVRLVVHGVLHLLGFDHVNVSRSKVQIMRSLEAKLVKKLAIFAEKNHLVYN